MKWIDVSTFSKNDTERLPSVFSAKAGLYKVALHRHIHYAKDDWLLSCYGAFENKVLKSKDIGDAKSEAEIIVRKLFNDALNSLDES